MSFFPERGVRPFVAMTICARCLVRAEHLGGASTFERRRLRIMREEPVIGVDRVA